MSGSQFVDLQNTFRLLENLACHSGGILQDQSLLKDTFLEHLRLDGYQLQPLELIEHRNLQEGSVSGSSFYMDLALIFFCVLCAGLASGLTQGLLSLDFLEMKIKSQSGTPKEKEYATRVLPIIKHHHLLLVTLMLWNASATEALPLFLNSLVPEFVAIIISVTLVLMFGEIIPASILTGPRQLEIVSFLTPLVYLVYFIFFPVAYPISKVLDFIIGHEEGLTLYSRREIITMMRMQHEEAARRHGGGGGNRDTVHNDEMMIIDGALTFRDMKVSEVMTPIDKAFMISANENLSYKTLYDIFKAGYSRIPVYEKDFNDIVGLLLAKDLIFVDPEDETPISNFVEFFGRRPMMVWHDQLLGEVLAAFRRERAHLAIVRDVVFEGEGDPYYKVVGIITLEDILEEILGAEIEDEFDVHDDEESTAGGAGGGEGRDPAQQRLDRHLRDMDLARLKSLRSKITDDTLSADEIQAIVHFLPKNVPQVKEYIEKYKLSLTEVIQKSHVFLLKKQTKEGALKPHPNDIIVKKGKFTNTCILILQGRVKIIQETESKEEINNNGNTVNNTSATTGEATMRVKTTATETIIGPWSTLCADALISSDGTYTPTFSAYIHSNDLRFVRLATIFSAAFNNYSHSLLERRRGLQSRGVTRSHSSNSNSAQAFRLRMSSSPDGELRLSRTRSHHGMGSKADTGREHTDSFLLRRSVTTQSGGFRARQELSAADALSTNSNNDRQSILLASFHESNSSSNRKSESIPIPGSSYDSRAGGMGSYQPSSYTASSYRGRSVSEHHDYYSDGSRLSTSLTRDSLLQSRMQSDTANSTKQITSVSTTASSSLPRPAHTQTNNNINSSVALTAMNPTESLRTPLIDTAEKTEEEVISQLHEEKK